MRTSRRAILALGAAVAASPLAASGSQQATTVFRGRPVLKVSEGGIERLPEHIAPDRAVNLECVISRIGENFYWASRENVELVAVESGAFVTYVGANGSGYVRVTNPSLKAAASAMSGTERRFDYIEHLLIGLRTVTYYGTQR